MGLNRRATSGDSDLAVANINGSLGILISSGDGTFQPVVNSTIGNNTRGITTGNYDGDGVATANMDGTVNVLEDWTGTGFFKNFTVALGGEPVSTSTIDMNGDGHPDSDRSLLIRLLNCFE